MVKSRLAGRVAQDEPEISQAQLRQARINQRLIQISRDDDASTTGRLVNPPAAIIPNPTGAGGQAGAQGLFGANLGAGTNATPVGTSRRPKGGDVNPMLAPVNLPIQTGGSLSGDKQGKLTPIEQVYGEIGGWLKGVVSKTNLVYPMYVQAQQTAAQNAANTAYIQGEHHYSPISAPILARLNKEREANTEPTSPFSHFRGTAGLYTYGQFSDKDAVFVQLMAAGLPTDIPASVADNLGLTASLSSPDSGWKLDPATGMWRAPAEVVNPQGATPNKNTISNNNTDFNQTGFYQDYIANNTPFEEQLRWDGTKYVKVGDWMNRNKRPSREAKLAQKRREWLNMSYDEREAAYGGSYTTTPPPELSQPAAFTGSWGVVNFNTGSG